jgi:hypothetical protein
MTPKNSAAFQRWANLGSLRVRFFFLPARLLVLYQQGAIDPSLLIPEQGISFSIIFYMAVTPAFRNLPPA